MRGADRLAFSTAETILDRIGNRADIGLFENQGFRAEQAEAGRVCTCQIAARQQLAGIETTVRVNPLFVVAERLDFLRRQEFKLGNADAVFAGNDAIQFSREGHDARHCRVRFLQHAVVVGIHRNVGVHIAVACVHMQRNKYAAMQYFLMERIELFLHLEEHAPRKNLL